MREKERTVQALAGRKFPKLGDAGVYHTFARLHADVLVTRMSADGTVLTVRFLGHEAIRMHGAFRVVARFLAWSNGLYVYENSDGTFDWITF